MQYEIRKNRYKEKVHLVVYAIGIYILLLPFDCFRVGNLGSLLKVYAIVPVMCLPLTGDIWKIKYNRLLALMVLYLFWTFFSCIYSINTDISLASFFSLALNMIFAMILGSMYSFNEREKKLLLNCLIISGWIMVACFMIFGSRDNWSGRLVLSFEDGSSQDANYANGYMLFTFAYHIHEAISRKKVTHFAAAAVLLGVVVMTGSRGALVAFAVCILFAVAWVIKESRRRMKIMLISVIAVVVLYNGFVFLLEYLDPALAVRFSVAYISEHGTTGRSEIWKDLLQTFANAGFFREFMGWGYGTTRLLNTTTSITTAGLVAHNLYIDNLMSIGILGVLLQIFMQIECARILLKNKNAMLICTYGAFLAMCMSLSLVNYKPMWCIMMIALILKNNPSFDNKERK